VQAEGLVSTLLVVSFDLMLTLRSVQESTVIITPFHSSRLSQGLDIVRQDLPNGLHIILDAD
jgi:hypothetical protein